MIIVLLDQLVRLSNYTYISPWAQETFSLYLRLQ